MVFCRGIIYAHKPSVIRETTRAAEMKDGTHVLEKEISFTTLIQGLHPVNSAAYGVYNGSTVDPVARQ